MTHHKHEVSDENNEIETTPIDTEETENTSSKEISKEPTFWIDAALL